MNQAFLNSVFSTPLGIFELVSVAIIGICVFLIILAVIINFSESNKAKTKIEKKSIVETGTMFLFFVFYYLVLRFRIGSINYNNLYVRVPLIFISLIVIIFGTYVNIKGRFELGKNWANQIKIYKNQTFVRTGVYGFVRHPLYASLIWMFYAGSIIYFNYLAFLLNTFIFVPFMYYRAKQEEEVLAKVFKEYKSYKKEVGMFFPKIKWRKN